MSFVVKTNKGYIKRTSRFGAFHGSIVLTDNKEDAFRFTRRKDAESRAAVAEFRTKDADDEGRWYSRRGYDYDKFDGTLTTTVEEI